jgi:hypothetical protein
LTTVTRTHHLPTTIVRGPESSPAAEMMIVEVESIDFDEDFAHLLTTSAVEQLAPHRRNFASELMQGLRDFLAAFAGPAMTKTERAKLTIAHDKCVEEVLMGMSRFV